MKAFLSLGKKLLEASGQNMHSTLRGYWGELIMEYDYGEIETYIEEGSVGQEGSRYSPERIAGITEG